MKDQEKREGRREQCLTDIRKAITIHNQTLLQQHNGLIDSNVALKEHSQTVKSAAAKQEAVLTVVRGALETNTATNNAVLKSMEDRGQDMSVSLPPSVDRGRHTQEFNRDWERVDSPIRHDNRSQSPLFRVSGPAKKGRPLQQYRQSSSASNLDSNSNKHGDRNKHDNRDYRHDDRHKTS